MLLLLLCLQAADLARDGKALLPIRADEARKAIARELAAQLGRLSGATFEIADGPGPGIVLSVGKPDDEFGREAYSMKSGPDGLKLDAAGNLFATGPGGVLVFAPDGTHLGTIHTGRATANCAWGGDGSDLYLTAGAYLARIRLTTRGARWPARP